MRRAVYLLLIFLFASPSFAQTCQTDWSSVQASKIIDLSGSFLASGTLSITGVDANRNIINFGAPGGGAVMTVAKKAPISNGAIVGTLCVPRSDKASVYVRYHIVIVDNSASGTHAVVLDVNDVPITTDVFSLDAYPFPADAYANPPNIFTSGHVLGDLTVDGTVYAGTISGATAVNAQHANTADTATSATTATTATNANHATTADSATTATTANSATTATTASSATVANALAATPADCGTQAINGINADGSPKSCIAPGTGGAAVGAAGTVQVSNGSGGNAAATPNNMNAALGSSNGLYIFGDSITQATGASSTGPGNAAFQQGYSYLWQQAVGGPFLLGGTSGDQEADVNYKWIYRVTNPQGAGVDPVFAHELGTNDAVNYLADANKQAIFQRLALGSLAWLAVPRANKIFAQNCTLAGGMAADTATVQVGLGAKATTSGATASCVINAPKASDAIYACFMIQDANTGTFTLSLDGTAQTDPFNGTTTWNAFGDNGALIHTQNGINNGFACARFTGVSAGNHTVLFTVTSATGSTAAVWPQWVGAAPASSTLNPYVIAISPNQQNTGSAGSPYAATYAGFINTIVGNLTADGLNVIYSDTSNALLNDPSCGNGNQATMFSTCYADNVHPNNAGHAVMAKTAEASTPSSFLLAVTRWNPKQPGQNYLASAPLTPYQWFDVNPYNLGSTTAFSPGVKFQGGNGQVFGITYDALTGLTVVAPSGTQGFTVCPWGGGGFMGTGIPATAACYFGVKMNGLIDFIGGSSSAQGTSIQSGQVTGGSNVLWYIPGTMKLLGSTSGVYPTSIATSTQNFNSPCWNFYGAVWDAVLNVPGTSGPCLQFVPTSPTPAGSKADGYLTLVPTASVPNVGLDLRQAIKTNHLGNADAGTMAVNSLTVNGVAITAPATFTTSSLGGSALAAGACTSTTNSVAGSGSGNRVLASPTGSSPGPGFYWRAYPSSVGVITTEVCAVVAGTPAAQTYAVEVWF